MAKKRTLSPTERAYSAQVKRIKNFIRRAEKRGYIFNENTLPTKPKRITQASVRRLQRLTPQQLYKKAQYSGQLSEGKTVSAQTGLQLEKRARIEKAKETRKRNIEVKKAKQYDENIRRIVAEELKYRQNKQDWKKNRNYEPEETEILELAADDNINPDTGEILEPVREQPIEHDWVQDNISEDPYFFDNIVIGNFRLSIDKYVHGGGRNIIDKWLKECIAQTDQHSVAMMLQQGAEAGLTITPKVMYDGKLMTDYITRMMNYLDVPEWYKDEMVDAIEMGQYDYEE